MVKRKKTNNDLQNTKEKIKGWAPRTPLKLRGELMCSGRVSNTCSINDTCCVTVRYGHPVGHKFTQTSTNNINKTWNPYKTNGNKDQTNIILRCNRNGHHVRELKIEEVLFYNTNNTNLTKPREKWARTRVLRKGRQLPLH